MCEKCFDQNRPETTNKHAICECGEDLFFSSEGWVISCDKDFPGKNKAPCSVEKEGGVVGTAGCG